MFFPLVAMVRVDLSNPNTLTPEEAAEIQANADKYNTNIDVVGSRAASRGRNVQPICRLARGQINVVILISDTMLATRRQRTLGQTSREWEEAREARAPDIARRIERRNRPLSASSKKYDNQLCYPPIYCVRLIGIGATDRCWMLDG